MGFRLRLTKERAEVTANVLCLEEDLLALDSVLVVEDLQRGSDEIFPE